MPHATHLEPIRPGTLAETDPTQLAVFTFLSRYRGTTLQNYTIDLKSFLGWCMAHDLPPLAAQRGHLELYIRYLEDHVSPMTGKPLAAGTVARRVGTVLLFYKFAVIDDYLPKNPGDAVKRPTVDWQQQKRTFLNPLEFAGVLRESKAMGPMAHATVTLLGMMGLRIHEACGLDVTSVHSSGGWEVIRFVGKGNKGAEMPIPVPVLRAVHAAIGERTDGPLLLNHWGNRMTRPNATALIRLCAARADVHTHFSPHSLRRTFVTSGLLNGVPLREMQIAARHADPGMTVRYDMMVGGHERHAAHRVAGYLASMAG